MFLFFFSARSSFWCSSPFFASSCFFLLFLLLALPCSFSAWSCSSGGYSLLPVLPFLLCLTLFMLSSVACLCTLFEVFFVASPAASHLPILLAWLGLVSSCAPFSFSCCQSPCLFVGFWLSCLLYPSSSSVSLHCSWGFLFFYCCSCLPSFFPCLRACDCLPWLR